MAPAKSTAPATTDLLKRSFPPVVDGRTRLLVLGSLPGEQSLAESRYYAHPRNHFWALIGAVVDRDLVRLDYQARLAALLGAGVGLWDVVASATRQGSLDTAIRDMQANPLAQLAATLPQLRALAFNGAKSAEVGRKALTESALEVIALPSSSPAYTLSFEAKLARWMELRHFL
ncbi:MAG TPA: DNA-deoxyinosine glycosylase [Allosphingosinicella sp.]|jgi:hypoxanthine-DNA glycosylase|uniref:DNA-deoxyinosine glycosylase n=1 Tax=Allosphingosinicella sp. TaxID=2823234 RepID=UPI002F29C272